MNKLLEQFFTALQSLRPDGIMVSNLGSLKLATALTDLPIQGDFSFNLFNHLAARFMKENRLTMGTASLELSFEQLRDIVENSELPIEVIVHGSYESMICDHNIAAMSLDFDPLRNPEFCDRHYALLDKAGEIHSLRMDQYGRSHILFAKDLCYYPYLEKFNGVASFRIEAQDYSAELTALLTKTYRKALDAISAGQAPDATALEAVEALSPRKLGVGVYRFRQSQNSL